MSAIHPKWLADELVRTSTGGRHLHPTVVSGPAPALPAPVAPPPLPRTVFDLTVDEILAAVDRLTERQLATMELRCRGLGCEGTARRLGVSNDTVRNHMHGAFKNLGLHEFRDAAPDAGWGDAGVAACYLLGRYHEATEEVEP